MSSPPAKRPQTENASITRSDVWYKDGSVVLQAQNTQFRVHWSVLSQHSSFFRDLEDLPQPTDQPTVDGCPIVELQDAVLDVEHLLKALYNPELFNQKALPFAYISSFVRLGAKYYFKGLFDIALERLAFENPTTLKEYDALFDTLKAATGNMIYSPTRIVNYPGLLFDIVTLARENNLLAILPCAYYRLAKRGLESIFQDIQNPDGTISVLSSADRAVCAVGHRRLLQAQWKIDNTLGWVIPWEPSDYCMDVVQCRRWQKKLLEKYLLSPYTHATISISNVQKRFCDDCAELAEAATISGRAKMWMALPSFFDLPPWDELKNSNEL